MKKSLLAAMAACALLATTTHAANTPQTNTLDLKGVSASAVIGGGGSGGMTAKSAGQFNATNFKADKTSPYPVGLAEDGTPLKSEVVADNKALWFGAKKPELVAVKAPEPNTFTKDAAALVDLPKNGSSQTVMGTGAQFTVKIVQRAAVLPSFVIT